MTYDSVKAITWTEKIWLLLAINVSVRCLSFLWILDSCIISVSSAKEAAKMHIYPSPVELRGAIVLQIKDAHLLRSANTAL